MPTSTLGRAALVLALLVAASAPSAAQDRSRVLTEGTVDAPPAQVWAAWTTSEGLRSWMAPLADIDLRVGGLMRANYDGNGSLTDDQTIVNSILSFEPERMLSIKVARTPKGFPYPNAIARMWTVIYLEPAPGERTKVRAVSLGFDDDAESQQMRAFFERGNALTLQSLQRRFAAPAR